MIRGRIDEDGNALVEVTVSGIRGSVMLNGHLDTEFSGDVSLPVDIAVTLGLELVMEIEFELADGSASRQLIFQGVADIGDGPRDVEILLSSSLDILVGRNWLRNRSLHANYATGELLIREEPPCAGFQPVGDRNRALTREMRSTSVTLNKELVDICLPLLVARWSSTKGGAKWHRCNVRMTGGIRSRRRLSLLMVKRAKRWKRPAVVVGQ